MIGLNCVCTFVKCNRSLMRVNVARPEVEPKTQLGKRLRHVRSLLEVADRDAFAEQLGIAKSSLANYERGERVPDASVLNAYKTVFG